MIMETHSATATTINIFAIKLKYLQQVAVTFFVQGPVEFQLYVCLCFFYDLITVDRMSGGRNCLLTFGARLPNDLNAHA